jgi:hypothetical protein
MDRFGLLSQLVRRCYAILRSMPYLNFKCGSWRAYRQDYTLSRYLMYYFEIPILLNLANSLPQLPDYSIPDNAQ